jgi:hypothetical protein
MANIRAQVEAGLDPHRMGQLAFAAVDFDPPIGEFYRNMVNRKP